MAQPLPPEYANALKRIAEDLAVRDRLQNDPVATLKELGVNVPADAAPQIRSAHAMPATAAWVSVVVNVATSPVVQVAVGADVAAKDRK